MHDLVRVDILLLGTIRVLETKHQAVSQGVRRFGKRSLFGHM